MRELPNTPAADHDIAKDLSRVDRRERLKLHLKRALLASFVVATIGAGASIYLYKQGIERCDDDDAADTRTCTRTYYYAFTVQRRIETTTKDDVLHGMRREWHITGAPWIAGEYRDGVRVGLWREWFSDGTPRFEGHYVNDSLDGTETWFYGNGNRELQVSHVLGARDGEERWWHENGALRRVGAYVRGEREGTFNVFDESGALAFTVEYEDGVRVSGDAAID